MNKQEYLTTEHWQKQRRGALARAVYRCQVCNADDTPLEVHHRTYARLGREEPSDLFVLCESCYDLFSTHGKLAPIDEDDEGWDEDDDTVVHTFEELDAQGGFQVVVRSAINHPRFSLGGGSLFLSVAADLVFRLDSLWVVLGLGAAVAIGWKADDLVTGTMKLLVPGSDQEQVNADADHFAEEWLADYPVYADQSVKGKLKRLFRGEAVDALPRKKEGIPHNRGRVKTSNEMVTNGHGEGLTYDRIARWFDEGRIDDVQFFALLNRIDTLSTNGTRTARIVDANPPPEADVSPKNGDDTHVSLPSGWTEEGVALLPGFYRVLGNLDKSLTAIGVSTHPHSRDFGREILKQQGLWKEK